ncbi:MAG: DUF1015 domain-containing protein [Thermoleophilia bacterium]|nr:DUF1015 domain-containing protein [Thermoleophilia bacterium]
MAEIAPLKTLRYDTAVAGSLQTLVSPPYDVIDPPLREKLAGGNKYNVVQIDLPLGEGQSKYAHAAELLREWRDAGALITEDVPAIWMLRQNYTGPDGAPRTRQGIFCRVRVQDYGPGKIRPHERTHPGPKRDRLELMRATRANLSPIFSLFSDDGGDFARALARVAEGEPYDTCSDLDGSRNTLWRVGDEQAIAAFTGALEGKELLIADGHHRYETARAYAEEVGGEGEHNYVLMFLCALQDPGMTVFATHRLIANSTAEQREAVRDTLRESFEISEIDDAEIAPPDSDDTSVCEFGYMDSFHKQAYRLRLKDQSIADTALAGMSAPYRRLDTAILEALLLKGALGMSDDAISQLKGLWYSSDVNEARELVRGGQFDMAFFTRPTPIRQIQEIAAQGDNMPPKSTYFYPKIPTGMVFNPLF